MTIQVVPNLPLTLKTYVPLQDTGLIQIGTFIQMSTGGLAQPEWSPCISDTCHNILLRLYFLVTSWVEARGDPAPRDSHDESADGAGAGAGAGQEEGGGRATTDAGTVPFFCRMSSECFLPNLSQSSLHYLN